MTNEELYTKVKGEVLAKYKIDLVHEDVMRLHCRALACHCECLGMNAENSFAICVGKQIPYGDDSYLTALRKWELINEEGNPTF